MDGLWNLKICLEWNFSHSALAEIAQFQAKNVKFDPIKFHHFMGNHQALMFPSIQMQQALHKKVCGAGFWEKHRKQREARSHGVYMSLAHFIMSVRGSMLRYFCRCYA